MFVFLAELSSVTHQKDLTYDEIANKSIAAITTGGSFNHTQRFIQVSKKFIDVITQEPRFAQLTLPPIGV